MGGFLLIDLDSLLTFVDDKEEKEYLESFSKSINAQKLKKKILQNAYSSIENFYQETFQISEKAMKEFQLKKYQVHPQLTLLNELFHQIYGNKEYVKCSSTGRVQIHECGDYSFSPHYCRNRHYCPICNYLEAMQKMISTYRVLTLLDTSTTNEMDFYFALPTVTYPNNYFDIEIMSKNDIQIKMFENFNEWKKKCFGKHTALNSINHTWSSEEPFRDDPHFHSHGVIPEFVFYPVVEKSQIPFEKKKVDLDYVINKMDGTESGAIRKSRNIVDYSKIKRIRLHRTEEELEYMKTVWKEILGLDPDMKINLFWIYTNKRNELIKYLKYIYRGHVHDCNKYLLEINPNMVLEEKHIKIFDYHNTFNWGFNRIRWYGFLCNSQRGTFLNWFIPKNIYEKLLDLDKTFEVCGTCFKKVDFSNCRTVNYDKDKHVRTIRMNMIIYITYQQNYCSRISIKKGELN